ncbi:winged helix domain-containing protein [Maricaulis sp. CAU 1757]
MANRKLEPQRFEWMRDGEPCRFILTGRDAWALSRLIAAGAAGVTPLSEPTGPRWSAYVYNLKRAVGLSIETVTEKHGGPFPGTHARYVLHEDVRLVEASGGDNAEAA